MSKKLWLILPVALLILLFSGCGPKNDSQVEQSGTNEKATAGNKEAAGETEKMKVKYMDVSVEMAKKMIDENPKLIVVDVSPKYAQGHLPGAVNYYVGDGSLDRAIPNLDPEANYLVYCHVDSASILGAEKLVDAGFKNVFRMEGNYSAWAEAGYPIEK